MAQDAKATGPLDVAGVVVAEQGVVLIDGPDGLTVAMTPEAAAATGERLIHAAEEARQQRAESNDAEPDGSTQARALAPAPLRPR